MADALTQFWQGLGNLLTGNQQQQPISSSQGQSSGQTPQAPAMPQQPGGLEGLLNNPAVQGGLATYFSLLAQPKVGGWGRGLGNAGLSGLQAYEGARSQQLQMPMQQAELAAKQAEVPHLQAETAGEVAKNKFISGLPPEEQKLAYLPPGVSTFEQARIGNQAVAQQLRTEAGLNSLTPAQKQQIMSTADMVAQSPSAVSLKDARDMAYTDPTLAGKQKVAQVQETEARTKQIGKPTPTLEDYWVPEKGAFERASAPPTPGSIPKSTYEKQAGDKTALQAQQVWQKAHDQAAQEYIKTNTSRIWGAPNLENTEAAARAAGDKAKADFLASAGGAAGPTPMPTTRAAFEALPPAAKEDWINRWSTPGGPKMPDFLKGMTGKVVEGPKISHDELLKRATAELGPGMTIDKVDPVAGTAHAVDASGNGYTFTP